MAARKAKPKPPKSKPTCAVCAHRHRADITRCLTEDPNALTYAASRWDLPIAALLATTSKVAALSGLVVLLQPAIVLAREDATRSGSILVVLGIIAVASMGFNHLWQDLGLDSRQSLRELMQCCFPELVAMNSQNMRWKKFFYRQQCALGGNYVCRAPSCDECVERASCFAPET